MPATQEGQAHPRTAFLRSGICASLGLWAVGCQTSEGVTSFAMAAVLFFVGLEFASLPRAPNLRTRLTRWLPLLAFVAWGASGPLLAGRLPTATGLARLSDWLGIPLAAYGFSVLDARQRRAVLVATGAALLLSCLAAGLQSYGLWPGEGFFLRASGGHFAGARVYEQVPGTHRFMGGGLLFHRLKFAHVSGLAVLALLVAGRHAKGRHRLLAWSAGGLGLLSVALFPFARAALAALLVSIIVALALSQTRPLQALVAGLVLMAGTLALVGVSPGLRARLEESFQKEGNGNREALWATGTRAIAAHPLSGVGLGRFRPSLYATATTPRDVLEHPGKSHNQYLTVGAELGLPGLFLFLLLLVWLARRFPRRTPEAAVGLSALVFFGLLSLLHDPLFHAPFSMALVLCLGGCLGRRAEA